MMESRLGIDKIFSDHMVLQKEKPIHIWGTCREEESVKVKLNHSETTAQTKGTRWTATLPPMKAARGLVLTITSGAEKIIVRDVAVGVVWGAGGQSNMEFHMRYDAEYETAAGNCENENIRFFDVPKIYYENQEKDLDFTKMGYWRPCDRENLEYYSAVGYYFAAYLQEKLNVPVGIIGCSKGGTNSSAWIQKDILRRHGLCWIEDYERKCRGLDFESYKERFKCSSKADCGNPFADSIQDRLMYGISHEEQIILKKQKPSDPIQGLGIDLYNQPGILYELMVKRIAGYAVEGILWYQGESDVNYPDCYKMLLSDLIDCWRSAWGENLPFICAQLAPFETWMGCQGYNFPIIRKAQWELSKEKQKVFLVSTSDAGMRYDIHPKRKSPIGKRMAKMALQFAYNKNLASLAPVGRAAYMDEDKILIYFENAGKGMKLYGNSLEALHIRDKQHREIPFHLWKAETEGNLLKLNIGWRGWEEGDRIEFACQDYYKVNLYNGEEIPALPFYCEIIRGSPSCH